MRIREIILTESYIEDLLDTVKDLLSAEIAKENDTISVDNFLKKLANAGYIIDKEELSQAIEQSEYGTVSGEEIQVSGMPGDISMSTGEEPDVGAMATDQAVADIGSELPQ